MATLVLTAVGSAVGGPIGSAIGAAIGMAIDSRLFSPGGREGPKLGQIAVQSASYGSALPRVYGTMRVAGTLIWALDIQENRQSVSGGKGRPKTTVYSYSASFAVALSARPAQHVGRIWADGKLLRGAAGDFKVATGFRFYRGSEDQLVDPLIAAAEGADAAPAYRGLCYVVFEDLALDTFGNRIPLLSFELIADAAEVPIADIIADLGGGAVTAACTATVTGYLVDASSQREALTLLAELYGLDGWDDGMALRLTAPSGTPRSVSQQDLGAQLGAQAGPVRRRAWAARAATPSNVRLGYIDPARDYQSGEQHADLFGEGQTLTRAIPAALTADAARQLALANLLDARARGDSMTISLPWRALDLLAAQPVQVEGIPGIWRVTMLSLEAMRLEVHLSRIAETAPLTLAADSGRSLSSPDLAHGPTRLAVVELPWLDAGLSAGPLLVAAAAGPLAGWRKAALLQSSNGGTSWSEIGETAAPATMGVTLDALPEGWAYGFDRAARVTVALLHDGMVLANCDDAALLNGANLMLIGGELLQFGRAERLGPARYRLSRLLRGRRGTEAAISGHQPGEDVLLLARDSLLTLDCPAGANALRVMATGIGDAQPVERICAIGGRASAPLSPVQLRAKRVTDGSVALSWIRRSRDGWTWPDGIDAPLAEESERYRVTLTPDKGPGWSEDIGTPSLTLAASKIAALRSAGATGVQWSVRQLGVAGQSIAAESRVELS